MTIMGMNVSEVSRFAPVRRAKRANGSQEWFSVQRVLFIVGAVLVVFIVCAEIFTQVASRWVSIPIKHLQDFGW